MSSAPSTPRATPKGRPIHDWTRATDLSSLTDFQQHIRTVDWTVSPLGPIPTWPDQLRQLVCQVVADPEPSAIYWGDEQAIVYNEAYLPLIGSKHPFLQGKNPRHGGFAELWDHFDGIILEGERTGTTHLAADNLVYIDRHGFLEECYFSYKLIPVLGPAGHVVASFTTAAETTGRVVAARRTQSVLQITNAISRIDSLSDLWRPLNEYISSAANDVAFATLYKYDSTDKHHPRICRAESDRGRKRRKMDADAEVSQDIVQAMQLAHKLGEPCTLTLEDGTLDSTTFPRPVPGLPDAFVARVIVWPVSIHATSTLFVVLGLNPRAPYDAHFRRWLSRLMDEIIASKISSILLAQEQVRGARLEKEAELDKETYQSLLREESKFSSFADRTTVGLVVTNAVGDVTYANASWFAWTGLEPGNISREDWAAYTVDEDASIIAAAWRGVTVDKTSQTIQVRTKAPFHGHSEQFGEMTAPHKTGFMVAWPELDNDGHVIQIFGMVVDISELKWNEEQIQVRTRALELSEAKYRRFAEHAPIGLVKMSVSGEVDFANNAWTELFGMQPVSGTTLPFLEVVHPDDVNACQQFYSELCTSDIPKTCEVRLLRDAQPHGPKPANLQSIYVLISGHTELRPDGEPDHLIWWATDISSQKAAERALSNRMEEAIRQKAQQEAFSDMISHEVRNPMAVILHCADEILYFLRSCDLALVADQRSDSTAQRDSLSLVTMQQNASEAADTIVYCIDYQKKIIEDVMMLSRLDGGLLEFAPSPVRLLQLVQQAIEIFDNDWKRLSIDFSFFKDSQLDEPNGDWTLLDPSHLLQVLVNILNNISASLRQSGRRQIHLSITRPGLEGIERVIETFDPLGQSTHDILLKTDSGVSHTFAITEVNDIDRSVRYAELTEQLSSAKTHVKYGEAGLGLFIARRLVEEMGGRIGLAPDTSDGNTISFVLESPRLPSQQSRTLGARAKPISTLFPITTSVSSPINIADILQRRSKSPSHLLEKVELSTAKVCRLLVVEDNLVNQKIMCKQLRARGFEVTAANHGQEALEALEAALHSRQTFDLILCDLEMPIMSGIDCVLELRRRETQGLLQGRIPVIAVTANARSEQVQAALQAGMDSVTTKPYRMESLIFDMKKFIRIPDD